MCMPSMMYLYHKYTYQDLCPWIICILTRTYVLGSCIYLLGPMSLDHMYTVLTRTYVLGSYVYCTYQDLRPWIICILTRTFVLGSCIYLPGPTSLDHMYTYRDLCPSIICILYLPGPTSLDHMYTYQDLRPWIICILTRTYILGSYVYLPGPRSLEKNRQTRTRQTHTQTKNMGRSMYRQVEIEVYRCWLQK